MFHTAAYGMSGPEQVTSCLLLHVFPKGIQINVTIHSLNPPVEEQPRLEPQVFTSDHEHVTVQPDLLFLCFSLPV